MLRICIVFATLLCTVNSSGYLSDCPGLEPPPPISDFQLFFLTIRVHSHGKLFSRRIYNYHQIQHLLLRPNTDFTKPTVMYVGGYMENAMLSYFAGKVKKEYSKLGYNVMLLNTFMFTATSFPKAASKMQTVGKHAAEMLVEFTKYGLDPKNLQLLGLGLGAQTASFIAKNFYRLTGTKISRITALDPIGLCFRHSRPEDRLDDSDADFVDVINTNIDEYGMAAPVGHVNIYVNGGEYQPFDIYWLPCTGICSHIKSFTTWMAAVQNPDSCISMKCNSVQDARFRKCYDTIPMETNVVGLNTDRNMRGIFYLATSNTYPYCMGWEGVKKKNEIFQSRLNLNKDSSSWL